MILFFLCGLSNVFYIHHMVSVSPRRSAVCNIVLLLIEGVIECLFVDPNPRPACDRARRAAVAFLSRASANKLVTINASLLGVGVH